MTDPTSNASRGVRIASGADRSAVVRILTTAFYDDPLMRWVFPHASRRRGALRRVFEIEADFFMRRGIVLLTENQQAAATWLPPGIKESFSVLTVVRSLPVWLAAAGPFRAIHGLQAFAMMERKHPSEKHYYLGSIGVDPEAQGRGLGSLLLGSMMPRIDDERMPSYLQSSNERNLPLYERFGFRVTEVIHIPHGGPRVWAMWRDHVS